MKQTIDNLAELFSRDETFLFIGAGLSIGAGLPGWADLVRPLAQASSTRWPVDENDLTVNHLLAAVQRYENRNGRHLLLTYLRDALDTTNFRPTSVHRALVNLPNRIIFTTNYDDLIERALRQVGKKPNVIINESDLAFWQEKATQVIKLCGDLARPNSIVITEQDFNTYIRSRARIAERLRVILESKTPLFLGYSLQDPFFNQIWDTIGVDFGALQRSGYAVLFGVSASEIDDWRRRHINIIELPRSNDDRNTLLTDWISLLSARVGQLDSERDATPPQTFEALVESKLDALLSGQAEIRTGLRVVYQRMSSEDRDVLVKVLKALENGRGEQAEIARMVSSLRRWAKHIQQTAGSTDQNLREALNTLEQPIEDTGGVYQYLEASLPLIPGILTYKLEIGSEHRLRLRDLWKEIKHHLLTPSS